MDDRGSSIWAKIMAIPIMALFLGVGILAWRIAEDWSPRQTDTLIGGGLAICGAGLAIFAIVMGSLAGMALYRKIRERPEQPPGDWRRPAIGYREPAPPMIEASKQGSWASNGLASYDVWEEEPQEAWSQGQQQNWS